MLYNTAITSALIIDISLSERSTWSYIYTTQVHVVTTCVHNTCRQNISSIWPISCLRLYAQSQTVRFRGTYISKPMRIVGCSRVARPWMRTFRMGLGKSRLACDPERATGRWSPAACLDLIIQRLVCYTTLVHILRL